LICNKLLSFSPAFSRIFRPTVLILLASVSVCAQTAEQPAEQPDAASVQTRIERARALAAAHKLQSAAHELEAIRKVATDDVLKNVTSVMLMGICLEEGNYTRAESLLEEDFSARATGKDAALRTYFAIAGQAVQGARAHIARYRSFGINVTEANLPLEAASDLEKLRSLLEKMVTQAKQIAGERKSYDALGLLEDVVGIRLSLPRDMSDREKWEEEYASARQIIASSQTQIASLGTVPPLQRSSSTPVQNGPSNTSVLNNSDSAAANSSTPPAAGKDTAADSSESSLLNAKATKRVVPTYPALAKSTGIEGVVRVHVAVDEEGKVIGVFKAEGPILLRPSAEQAARGWRFSPTLIDGKPVRLTGYIEFTYTRK
jgi:TonB family protein